MPDEHCKETIAGPGGWFRTTCSRKPKRDGYCTQHHPDNVAKRRAAVKARYDEQWRRSTEYSQARTNVVDAACALAHGYTREGFQTLRKAVKAWEKLQ